MVPGPPVSALALFLLRGSRAMRIGPGGVESCILFFGDLPGTVVDQSATSLLAFVFDTCVQANTPNLNSIAN